MLVTELARSIEFWCGPCGLGIQYDHPEEGFAYITRGNALIMLEQRGAGRNWLTDELELPFGRRINFQIGADRLEPILSALTTAAWPIFLQLETKWYRAGDGEEAGARQFLVIDPDGYLVGFQSSVGRRHP